MLDIRSVVEFENSCTYSLVNLYTLSGQRGGPGEGPCWQEEGR